MPHLRLTHKLFQASIPGHVLENDAKSA